MAISSRSVRDERPTHRGEVWRDWQVDRSQPNARLMIAVREEDGLPLFLEPSPRPTPWWPAALGSGKSVRSPEHPPRCCGYQPAGPGADPLD